MSTSRNLSRRSREEWLAEALEALARDPAHLRIEELADRLGVSKGSFYWHFENRSEFIHALANFWKETQTAAIAGKLAEIGGTPEERLRTLMQSIVTEQLNSYDIPIRAFARIEPGILPVIRETDEIRLNTVRSLFEDIGFEEPELSIRTRVFVVAQSFDDALGVQLSREETLEQLELRFAFFTRR